jgi:hypothetical protein
MIYLLFSDETISLTPENGYGGGITMPFKRGLFLFDTEKTDINFWEREDYIELDGHRYRINKSLIFKNIKKAEIVFLRLKIDEMSKNSMKFFFPNKYDKLLKEFNRKVEENPEYAI